MAKRERKRVSGDNFGGSRKRYPFFKTMGKEQKSEQQRIPVFCIFLTDSFNRYIIKQLAKLFMGVAPISDPYSERGD